MPTLPKIFRHLTRNTFIFLFGLSMKFQLIIKTKKLKIKDISCFLTLNNGGIYEHDECNAQLI